MDSYRRPRGKIFFEVLCALLVGASFVGAWIQTGAWAFLGPAFVFTLFGLYWAFDLFARSPQIAREAATASPEPVPVPAHPETDIRYERFEAPVVKSEVAFVAEPFPEANVVPFAPAAEPIAAPKAKAKKPRAKKVAAPMVEPEPTGFADEAHAEAHIEPLFDPQPFARQARPAFGKRPRGPGPRPLPA